MGERIELFGCFVDNLSMEETLRRVEAFVRSGQAHRHVSVNVDKIVKASRDDQLRNIINSCDLISADGMPVVWASRLLGKPLKERVAGIDLFDALMHRAAKSGWRVYLLGATEDVVREVSRRYLDKYPKLRLVGLRNGYWAADDEQLVVQGIREAKPDLLFVAISSPAKERFLGEYQSELRIPFAMGVGGSFDVVAGKVRRAPAWIQRAGIEWFFRFLQEPGRMYRRYFLEDVAFIGLLAKAIFHRAVRRS